VSDGATALTYAEARERSRLIDVLGYQVDLDVTGDEVFGSATVIRFRCRRPGASSFVELRPAACAGRYLTGATWIGRAWTGTGCP
jgi:aminopeptidase N